jgi:Tol biopolymer transport system component
MRSISSLAVVALLIGVTGSPGCAAGAVEHGNVAFDVSPDGKRIVFSAADGDLYLFDLETRHVDRLTSTEDTESSPAFSPDGRSVVLATSRPRSDKSNLAVLDLDVKRVRVLTNPKDASDSSPAFSRDGKRIALVRAHLLRPYSMGGFIWDDYDIYVTNADGSEPRRLTRMNYHVADSPHFTADGDSVIFAGNTNNYPASSAPLLLEVAADGTGLPHTLGPGPEAKGAGKLGGPGAGAWASDPHISLDGKAIAFISDRGRNWAYDIHVMKRDGSATRALGITSISEYNQSPVFLPDGKAILFLAGTEDNAFGRPIFSLWQVDVDGKNARRIADSGLFTDPLNWKPKP